MQLSEINAQIKSLEEALKGIDEVTNLLNEKSKKIDGGHRVIELSGEEYAKLNNSISSSGRPYSALHNTKARWVDLKNEETKLSREYTQQVKLDRTIKINSFILRIFTAFGVVAASIIALNIADKLDLNVPWIVSRNVTATNLPNSEVVSINRTATH